MPDQQIARLLNRALAVTFASAEEFLGSDRVKDTKCLISDVQMYNVDLLQKGSVFP